MRRVMLILLRVARDIGLRHNTSLRENHRRHAKTIVDVIECEIIAAKRKNTIKVAREQSLIRAGKLPRTYPIRDLKRFVAVAELTLQVDEQATLAPSFTHTDIVSKTSRAPLIGA